MSCLSIIIERLGKCLDLIVERIGGIAVNISRYDAPMVTTITDVGNHLKVSCGIVCNVNNSEYIIRFEKATLFWNASDNRVGTTKYNTLVASGDWTLEEIVIEELL